MVHYVGFSHRRPAGNDGHFPLAETVNQFIQLLDADGDAVIRVFREKRPFCHFDQILVNARFRGVLEGVDLVQLWGLKL